MISNLKFRFNESFLCLLLFLIVLFFLDINSFYFLKPRSVHFIRQTDTLTFVDYYVFRGFNFFETGNLNLYNETGKSLCEFPIIYFIAAFFVKFGFESYLVIKTIHLFIFGFTVLVIFNYLKKQFNLINSFSILFLLFSSTVILYYSINYIPNFPALCFCLCGIIYFFKFYENSNKHFLFISIMFFLVSSLLKVTFTIYPITCFLLICYKSYKEKTGYKNIGSFFLLYILLFVWNLFVIKYNKINNADYYLTSIKPFWNLDKKGIDEVLSFVFNYWKYLYYFPSTIHIFLIVIIVSFFYIKKMEVQRLVFVSISFLGVACYFMLFFSQFRDHDYYFMEFVPFFFIIFITSYKAIIDSINKKIAIASSLVLVSITCLSLNYAKLNLYRRYEKPFEQVSYIAKELENIKPKLDSINISKEAKILVVPDNTMNGSLYYLNRFGYTVGDTVNPNLSKYYYKSDYILVTDSLLLKTVIKKFSLTNPVLKYKGTTLFKTSKNEQNIYK